MVSTEVEERYLYFGVGFVGLLILSSLVFMSAKTDNPDNSGLVTLSVKTTQAKYRTQVPEARLFAKEPNTVLFSPTENNPEVPQLQCTINCINSND